MNTISNPLILDAPFGLEEHFCNKRGDYSGEYIDKKIGQQALEAMEWALTELTEPENSTGDTRHDTITKLQEAIKNIK